ncbi:MAG: hypothetical protein LC104_08345 [Bacteroidales bacterium]|nr:hypothetical protein [Bacteroidales bacterium]
MKRTLLILSASVVTGLAGCGKTPPPAATDADSLKATEDAIKSAQQAEGATQGKK